MNDLSSRHTARIVHFWRQVEDLPEDAVSGMLASLLAGRANAHFIHLCQALANVHPGLALVVGRRPDRREEIVISADGRIDVMPAVFAVVDAAPDPVRARYEVCAFRPRGIADDRIRLVVGDTMLQMGDVCYTSSPGTRGLDLDIYLPGYDTGRTSADEPNCFLVEAMFKMLDHLVGEFNVMTAVGAIDPLPAAIAPPRARKLTALVDELDTYINVQSA